MARATRQSIIDKVRNWGAKSKIKAALLEGVKRTRGPGRGLDIPLSDRDSETVPLFSRALEELLREHPELQVLVTPKHLTLGYRSDFAAQVASQLRDQLTASGFLAQPGDELPVAPSETAGAGDPRDLYTEEELQSFDVNELRRLGFTTDEIRSLKGSV